MKVEFIILSSPYHETGETIYFISIHRRGQAFLYIDFSLDITPFRIWSINAYLSFRMMPVVGAHCFIHIFRFQYQ